MITACTIHDDPDKQQKADKRPHKRHTCATHQAEKEAGHQDKDKVSRLSNIQDGTHTKNNQTTQQKPNTYRRENTAKKGIHSQVTFQARNK